jgi:hypothetical protein
MRSRILRSAIFCSLSAAAISRRHLAIGLGAPEFDGIGGTARKGPACRRRVEPGIRRTLV